MMINLNEHDIRTLTAALGSLRDDANQTIDGLLLRLVEAKSEVKVDGTPKRRPGRPKGQKNKPKPAVKKAAPVVLKEAA